MVKRLGESVCERERERESKVEAASRLEAAGELGQATATYARLATSGGGVRLQHEWRSTES